MSGMPPPPAAPAPAGPWGGKSPGRARPGAPGWSALYASRKPVVRADSLAASQRLFSRSYAFGLADGL